MYNGKRNRLGLCCLFRDEDITFKSRQATYIERLDKENRLEQISVTVLHNASSLVRAIDYCAINGIGCFRVNSRMLPLKTHPKLQYALTDLPDYALIMDLFETSRGFARKHNIRLTFHPDQFTLLSSPREQVTEKSIEELIYHAEVAELIGADVITLHGGGAYGDKAGALGRVMENIDRLPYAVRSRLALENDDRVYSPMDLFPVCEKMGIPLVYDVHHHRCLRDELSIDDVTGLARKTWDREPLFHLSSPKYGWSGNDIRSHHDYINPDDMPETWKALEITIEIEAKAKELAVSQLQQELARLARVA